MLSDAQTPFPSATVAPGAATVNLRGLGVNRSLVLIDGRRGQPVDAQLVVDLNTIPSAAIDSVETITGGAAAVYGADAIAGVVNFKLKKDFQGLQLDGQYGITQQGDDMESQVSALLGGNFADDKGNAMLGVSFSQRGGVKSSDRSWICDGWADPKTAAFGGGTPPNAAALIGGQTWYVNPDGTLFQSTAPNDPTHPYTGPLGGTSGYKVYTPTNTLEWNSQKTATLNIPLTRYGLFASGHYDINDSLTAFAQGMYTHSYVSALGGYSGLFSTWGITVPYNPATDDPTAVGFDPANSVHAVPPQLAALLNAASATSWTYNGTATYLPPWTTNTTSDVFQITAGFDGKVPTTDWTWEVYGQYGNSDILVQQPWPSLPKVQALFTAPNYGLNATPTTYPFAVTGHCTSGLPIFNSDGSVNSSNTVSQDCADWAMLNTNTITQVTQQVVEADIQGGLFDMPFTDAGQVRFALGADYRSDDFSFNPDLSFNANQAYPNVVQNIALPVAVHGSTDVQEVYGELSIPILKDLPFVKSFEFDPGWRYSDYNTSGGTETYKLLGDWKVFDWLTLRGGFQHANRAPNVAELFTPIGGSSLTGLDASGPTPDPCATWGDPLYAGNVPGGTPAWGNISTNAHQLNVQALCQYLMQRDVNTTLYPGGVADVSQYMVPGSVNANTYRWNVFGAQFYFPYSIAVTQGNPNLNSELAKTWTWGAVIRSPIHNPLLDRLTISIDWYQIQISGAIAVPGMNAVYQECLDARYNSYVGTAFGTYTGQEMADHNPFCALINREYNPTAPTLDPYGAPRTYKAQYINTGGINTRGIDVQLDWGADLADMGLGEIPGSVNLNVVANFLQLYAVAPFPGAQYLNYTGTLTNNSYHYRTLTTLTYAVGPWSAGIRWQHLPEAGIYDLPTVTGPAAHDNFDLFARWSINDTYEVRAGVDNLLDAPPEWVGATATTNSNGITTSQYDPLGRRFYVGIKAKY